MRKFLEYSKKSSKNMLLAFFVFSAILLSSVEPAPGDLKIPEEHLKGLTQGKMKLEKQGISLHYVTGGNKNSENLMVFVHGFPEFWYAWRHQLQHFRKKNMVYAFDLRGFGLSDWPSGGAIKYTIDEHVEDIAEAIQMLKAKPENAEKHVTLVCHDIGAAIGSMLNYHYPDLLDHFVMMNAPNPRSIGDMQKAGTLDIGKMLKTPYLYKILGFQLPWVGEQIVKGQEFAFLKGIFLTKGEAVLNQGKSTFDRDDLEVYKRALKRDGAITPAINFFRAPIQEAVQNALKKAHEALVTWALHLDKKEEKQKLPDKIKAKCLVIWGKHDVVFGVEFGQAAVNACEDGQLVVVNSSHWVPEDVPEQVNQLIEQFIHN